MKNSVKFLNEKGIMDILKKIKMSEFKEFCNKYITDDLQLDEKYNFNGRNNIHSIITENIAKGIKELWQKYNIDYAMMTELFHIGVWRSQIMIDYETIYAWEDFGAYSFGSKIRKNASVSNSSFRLTKLPTFAFYDEEIEDLSIYDFIVRVLNNKRNVMIEQYKKEIEEYTKNIEDNKKKINELNNILL